MKLSHFIYKQKQQRLLQSLLIFHFVMLCIGHWAFFQFIFNLFVMCFQSGYAGVLLGNIVQIKYKQNIKYKMQAKKRGAPVKKNATKLKPQKALNDNSDTINTTKEKTFATIEETFEFQDHKTSTRTTHYTSRRDCIDRMEANKLSPFSSPGQSLSPKHRKSLSPFVVKQKQIKKIKKGQPSDGINNTKKITNVHTKTVKSSKQKSKNAQKIKIAFENDFLKKLSHFNKKKITEVSDEMEDSIRKSKKLLLTAKRQATNKLKKNKLEIIRQIHLKVKQKYRRQYPNLKPSQLKILSAVVLIQRLWRQTKVKSMIGQFLSPRNLGTNKFYNNTFRQMHFKSENDQRNSNIIDLSHNQQTMKTQKSFPSLSPKSIKVKQDDVKNVQQLSSIQNGSQILFTPAKSTINLKELEVSDELSDVSSTKAKQILKYIDMYRQVTLKQKKEKKKKKLSKPNAFNFPESLSEKCLLQNLYKKRISNIKCLNEKVEISQLFLTSASMQKAKQMYVSPKKPQIVQLQQRFYTEAQDEQFPNIPAKQEKDQIKLEDQTVGSIGNVGSKIVQMLILQFSEQFQAFTSKKCLKKKKRLPGITINDLTIQTYLNQFVNHIKKQYCGHFENSFTKISANNFLKFLRVPPEQDIFEPGDEEQDEEQLNFPVLPCSAFFQFQPIYQQKIFSIKQEDKKYSNFLSGLIKIHNKCLADSFSDFIQKQRLESIEFPWDKICPAKSQKKIEEQIKQKMPQRITEIQKRIVSLSSTRLGRLHKKDMQQEQINLLKSLKEDYKREGKDWSQHQQLLEVRLEITELITQQLILELSTQMTLFITA